MYRILLLLDDRPHYFLWTLSQINPFLKKDHDIGIAIKRPGEKVDIGAYDKIVVIDSETISICNDGLFDKHDNVSILDTFECTSLSFVTKQYIHRATGILHAYQVQELEDKVLQNKLRPWFSLGSSQYITQLSKFPIKLDNPRSYSVHFLGNVEFLGKGYSQEIHRKKALESIRSIPHAFYLQKELLLQNYLRTMYNSRAVLSPWGWGEVCYRDYEAMLLGCVLIKPGVENIKCWPEIFFPGKTYVPCRMDFEDVPEIVDKIMQNWDDYREMREKARQCAMRCFDMDYLQDLFMEAII